MRDHSSNRISPWMVTMTVPAVRLTSKHDVAPSGRRDPSLAPPVTGSSRVGAAVRRYPLSPVIGGSRPRL